MTDTKKGKAASKEAASQEGLDLIQRSYWVTKKNAQQLATLKSAVFDISTLSSVDLSAVLRGLIEYGEEMSRSKGPEFMQLVSLIEAAKNPKKPGAIRESIR